jgi:hypothetical protein
MNKAYGGAQPRMRESNIKEDDGYLGMNQRTLSVGDTQLFTFQPGDIAPAILDDGGGKRAQPP